MRYPDKWKRRTKTFTKAFSYQIWKELKHKIKFIYSLDLKIVWSMIYPEMN